MYVLQFAPQIFDGIRRETRPDVARMQANAALKAHITKHNLKVADQDYRFWLSDKACKSLCTCICIRVLACACLLVCSTMCQ
jgi:hypothetical protein